VLRGTLLPSVVFGTLRLGSLARLAGATGDVREALLATRELLPLLVT